MKDVNCKYSNGIVPYMYGELAASAATEFESHLLECEECTDEFAAMSAARYEVYDWKKLAFDPLATPAIEIPFGDVVAVSWIEKLRAAFAGSWAMPAAAFAGLAVIAILLTVLVTSRNNDSTVAQQRNGNGPANVPVNTNKTAQPPASEPKTNDIKVDAVEPVRSEPRPAVINDTPNRRVVRPQQVPSTRSASPRTTTAQTPNAPRLNDFTEEEDNTLRLAELFEDIDTSE